METIAEHYAEAGSTSSFLRFDTGLECKHMDEKRKSDVAELRELKNLYLGKISFEVLKVKRAINVK